MGKTILFDVDGTLMDIPELGERVFPPVLKEVFKRDLFFSPRAQGLTDQAIVFKFMQEAGLGREEIKKKMGEAMEKLTDKFRKNIETDLRPFVLTGVRALLEALRAEGYDLGLLTGNVEEIAWEKMRRAGLEGIFEFGGFGSDAVERNELVPIARKKAEKLLGRKIDSGDIIVVGDTPRDAECAKAGDSKFMGVATGIFSVEDLEKAGAKLVFDDFSDTGKILKTIKEL